MRKEKDFKDLMDNIQKKINKQEETTFSKVVIDEYNDPCYFGFIEKPDAFGKIKGPCGDTMQIFIKIKNKVVKDARFWTDGCGATVACGNRLIKIIRNKTLDEIADLSQEKLIDELDGLPDEHLHCAKLSVDTLKLALSEYKKKRYKTK